MTVAQAVAQCMGHLRTQDITELSIEESAEVIRAVNRAIQTYYREAPDLYKRTTVSEHLAAPQAVSGFSVAVNSTTNTGTTWSANDRGKTIQIGDDPNFNEITSTTTLLRPHQGSGTATSGTIYHDTVCFFDMTVDRIVSDVRVIYNGQTYKLARATEKQHAYMYPWVGYSPFALTMGYWSPRQRSLSDLPRWYSALLVGDSVATGTGDARFMIRLDPIPTRSIIVEMELDILPTAYTVEALFDGTELPTQNSRVHSLLLPMVEYYLLQSSLWRGRPEITQIIMQSFAEAREAITRLPAHVARPTYSYGTRNGW